MNDLSESAIVELNKIKVAKTKMDKENIRIKAASKATSIEWEDPALPNNSKGESIECSYIAVVMPPGSKKSLIKKTVFEPVFEWQDSKIIEEKTERDRLISEKKTLELGIENKRKKMFKEKASLENVNKEISSLEQKLPIIPHLTDLVGDNITLEALTVKAYQQGGYYGCISDEGGIMENFSGLYSGGKANIDIVLKGIDGGRVAYCRRLGEDVVFNAYLNFLLLFQPQVLQEMSKKQAFKGRGFIERFFFILPENRLQKVFDSPAINREVKKTYQDAVRKLLNLSYRKEEQTVLTLSEEAYTSLGDTHDMIEEKILSGEALASEEWCNKLVGNVAKLAGLLHIAEYGSSKLEISKTTLQKAIDLALKITSHTEVAYEYMRVGEIAKNTDMIFQWIRKLEEPFFTKNDLKDGIRGNKLYKAKKHLEDVFQNLKNKNIIKEYKIKGRGRPTTIYFVNPRLFESKL